MKKTTVYILALVLMLSLCACGDRTNNDTRVTDDPVSDVTNGMTNAVDDVVTGVDDAVDGNKNNGAVNDKDGIIDDTNKNDNDIVAGNNDLNGTNGATATDVPPADELMGNNNSKNSK